MFFLWLSFSSLLSCKSALRTSRSNSTVTASEKPSMTTPNESNSCPMCVAMQLLMGLRDLSRLTDYLVLLAVATTTFQAPLDTRRYLALHPGT